MTTTKAHPYILSGRHRTVLGLLADGKSTQEMCDLLHLSDRTIKDAINDMFHMFGVKNRTGLVGKAFREGVLQ
jgi:DNA-binding CsgD family transcriptional regulator